MDHRTILISAAILGSGWTRAATLDQIGSNHRCDDHSRAIPALTDDAKLHAEIGDDASNTSDRPLGLATIPEPKPHALLLIAVTGALILKRRPRIRG